MPVFRKRYLINRDFQLSFIFKMVWIAGVLSGLLYVTNFILFWRFNYLGQGLNLDEDHAFYGFIQQQFGLMNTAYFVICGVILLILVASGLFLSHRIAGPLFHLKMSFEQIAKVTNKEELEAVAELRFRKSDFFHELLEDYNKHLINLKKLNEKWFMAEQELEKRGISLESLIKEQVSALNTAKIHEINDSQKTSQKKGQIAA